METVGEKVTSIMASFGTEIHNRLSLQPRIKYNKGNYHPVASDILISGLTGDGARGWLPSFYRISELDVEVMPPLVGVCEVQIMNEQQRRLEIQVRRRRARFERYRDKCNRKLESYSRDNALSVSYDGSRLEVRVQNPLTHLPEDRGRFTTYEIAIETNNISFTLTKSYVRRRFSEFLWLRRHLKGLYGDITPAALPRRTLWGWQFDPAIIEERLHGLQTFLTQILLQRVYLSDRALHLFVQSELSWPEIQDVIEGRDQTSVTEHILKSNHQSSSPTNRCSTCSEGDLTSDEGIRVSTSSSDSDLSFCAGHCDQNSTHDDLTESLTTSCPPPLPHLLSSTPRRSVSDSAISLHLPHDLTDSLESDVSGRTYLSNPDDDTDSSTSSTCSHSSISSIKKQTKSVLSQSLPTSHVKVKCAHRQRRVTFSTEVTVANVVEKVEASNEGQAVTMVKVRKAKDKTKGH